MTTTPTTQAAKPDAPAPDAGKVTALIGAIGTLEEAYVTITTDAFRSLCATMSEHVPTVNDYYNAVNAAVNGGKRNATPISFPAFYSALSAACVTLNRNLPERKATRIMVTFARQGATDKAQRKFLNVAGLTGEFGVSIEEYVRFLGVESDYTSAGALTSEAQANRAKAQAEREARDLVAKAAKKARPIGFDWSGMVPGDLRDDKHRSQRVAWLLQLQQDLSVFVSEQTRELTDPQRRSAVTRANNAIKAAAK